MKSECEQCGEFFDILELGARDSQGREFCSWDCQNELRLDEEAAEEDE